jgi:hypothetical protein
MTRLEAVSALLHTVLLVWVVLLAGCTITPAYAPPPYPYASRERVIERQPSSVVIEQPRPAPQPPAVIYQNEPSYPYPGY